MNFTIKFMELEISLEFTSPLTAHIGQPQVVIAQDVTELEHEEPETVEVGAKTLPVGFSL